MVGFWEVDSEMRRARAAEDFIGRARFWKCSFGLAHTLARSQKQEACWLPEEHIKPVLNPAFYVFESFLIVLA